MIARRGLSIGFAALGLTAWLGPFRPVAATGAAGTFPVSHTEEAWRKLLTSDQYAVLRQSGTEYPFTSPLLSERRNGSFACAGCDIDLFASTTKFDSGTG